MACATHQLFQMNPKTSLSPGLPGKDVVTLAASGNVTATAVATYTTNAATAGARALTPSLQRRGSLAEEPDHVHALRGRLAQLTQHRRHLAAVVARVVHHVLQHLPERARAWLSAEQLVLD